MKKLIIISISILCISMAWAVTDQWDYPVDGIIYQTCADGAGGCAIFYIKTNGMSRIDWLDKKGQEFYSKEFIPVTVTPILSCDKKNLVFSVTPTNGLSYLITVDKKGVESDIKSPTRDIYIASIPGFPTTTVAADKKGFFCQSVKTNNNFSTLIRFSYK